MAADPTSAWLIFLSSLIWQGILFYCLLTYRHSISMLFEKLSRLKVAGFEGEFQAAASNAPATENAVVEVTNIDENGFLTQDGIKQIIKSSGLLKPDEIVKSSLLIFRTKKQRTWLASTSENLFCILDDAKTRAKGTLIQWKQSLNSIKHVKAYRSEYENPVVDIGDHEGWLYSPKLHPDTKTFENEIRSMLKF